MTKTVSDVVVTEPYTGCLQYILSSKKLLHYILGYLIFTKTAGDQQSRQNTNRIQGCIEGNDGI